MNLRNKILFAVVLACLPQCKKSNSLTVPTEAEFSGSALDLLWGRRANEEITFIVDHVVSETPQKTVGDIGTTLVGGILQLHSMSWRVPDGCKHDEIVIMDNKKGIVCYIFRVVGNDSDYKKIISNYEFDADGKLAKEWSGYRVTVKHGYSAHLLFNAK